MGCDFLKVVGTAIAIGAALRKLLNPIVVPNASQWMREKKENET
jgi:hypothetical protein